MLEYSELKEAVDDGYIQGETVNKLIAGLK